jgi:F-type H+-transporting ATPase subunit gamma
MTSTRLLKSRIRSVRSNRQITKAMELVAASKLRHAQESSRATSAYAMAARELLTQLATLSDVKRTTFFVTRPVHTRLVILITADRGLAGAYNSNVIKQFLGLVHRNQAENVTSQVLCVGKRGAQFVAKLNGVEVVGVYDDIPEKLTANSIRPILVDAVDRFVESRVDTVEVVTTEFRSSLNQVATSFTLLPARFDDVEVSADIALATFEPSVEEVLDGAVIRLLEAQLYQALLDAKASEHSMRRVAMKNATDNATELVDDLTLEMNKVRQASITQELAEISGGAEAMK